MMFLLILRNILYGLDSQLTCLFCFSNHMSSYMSQVMRKPAFCICKNKDADQLRGNREADQRLCFHLTDNAIPLLSKSEISSL